jgi:hypothetical protein
VFSVTHVVEANSQKLDKPQWQLRVNSLANTWKKSASTLAHRGHGVFVARAALTSYCHFRRRHDLQDDHRHNQREIYEADGMFGPAYTAIAGLMALMGLLGLVTLLRASADNRTSLPQIDWALHNFDTAGGPLSSDYVFWPTMTLILGTGAWLVGTRFRRGAILSPYSMVLLILISIFGVRPLLMPGDLQSFVFYGYSIGGGFQAAAIFGFIGALSFVLGAAVWSLVLNRNHPPKQAVPGEPMPAWAPPRANAIALWLIGGWFLFMIVVGGGVGFLAQLFSGRSVAVISRLENVPAFVGALPVIGCLTVAVVRFQYERLTKYTRAQNWGYWLVAAAAIVPPLALGTRRYLIPAILIAVAGSMVNSWRKRVKVWLLALGAACFMALAILPFVRSAGSRTALGGDSDLIGAMSLYFKEEGIRGTLDNFFLSYDTEMFNYVAYMSQVMGKSIPFGMGRGTVGELVAMPLPAAITPFERWNDVLLSHAFGGTCGYQRPCPVPSIMGVLYSDLALPGLILGMLILGIMVARFEAQLLQASSAPRVAVLLLAAGFAIAFARGNSLAQVWIAVQCFIVWWGVQKILLHAPKAKPALKRNDLPEAYREIHARQ